MELVRVLYVNGGLMDRGGISMHMMNYYRHLDKSKVQIDFIVHGFEKGIFDDEIYSLGGKIYHVPLKSKDYFGNIKALQEIFNTGKYKIVHSHMDAMSMIVLKIAKKCGIPIRIAHSHNTQHLTNNKIKFAINEYARLNIDKYATHFFACSEKAGRWLFGDKAVNNGKVTIIYNAIELEEFTFKQLRRDYLRDTLDLKDNFVIGHIGRFDYQKNHLFLLDVFNETLKLTSNVKLLLVGDGHLKAEITAKIKKLDIEDKVILMGVRSDINDLLNAFDLFILPSVFEGLGTVIIEAQANGLRSIVSDGVPQTVNLTDLVKFISLSDAPYIWANEIYSSIKNSHERKNQEEPLKLNGYSIEKESERLTNIYSSLFSAF